MTLDDPCGSPTRNARRLRGRGCPEIDSAPVRYDAARDGVCECNHQTGDQRYEAPAQCGVAVDCGEIAEHVTGGGEQHGATVHAI